MRKNKFLKFLLIGALLVLSCENDAIQQELPLEQETPNYVHKNVALEDISGINDYLSSKMGTDITGKDNELNGAIFDTDNIIQVIDTLDNSSYSFSFTFPDTQDHVFYNLVLGVDANGNKGEPFVVKYISDLEHLDALKENGSNFNDFTGKVQLHQYTDYFKDDIFSKGDCETRYDDVEDPIPCLQDNVSNGGSGGAASSGGSAPGATSGPTSGGTGTGTGGCNTYYDRCRCGGDLVGAHNHTATTFVIDCGGGGNMNKSYTSEKSDCDCDINGAVGPNLLTSVKKLKLMVGLSDDQALTLQKYPSEASRMLKLLTKVDRELAENEIKMQVARLKSNDTNGLVKSSGKIANNDALEYTHIDRKFANGSGTLYRLKSGLFIARYGTRQGINKDEIFRQDSSLSYGGNFYYAYNPDTSNDHGVVNGYSLGWYEVDIIPPSNDIGFENALVKAVVEGAEFTGRYVLPIEDIVIMVNGKDFDGVERSRIKAAGYFIVGLVPGGKVTKAFKPIAKVVKGTPTWATIVKWGDKSYKLSFKVVNGIVDFGDRSQLARILRTSSGIEAHHIIPWTRGGGHKVVQAAAHAGFHLNMAQNGLGLKKYTKLIGQGLHGNHPAYDKFVVKRLDDFMSMHGLDPDKSAKYLFDDLIPEMKTLITKAKNSGMNLNDYFKQVVNPPLGI